MAIETDIRLKNYLNNSNDLRDHYTYEIRRPDGGWIRIIDREYARRLRPIAEVIALLDGNGFFDMLDNHYENYLQEADALYRANGGDDGWAQGLCWIQQEKMIQEDPALKDLWDKLQVMIELKRKKNEDI
jgi:hypothetical protein